MKAGIFSIVWERPTLAATLDAVATSGIRAVQFDMESAGLATLPDAIPPGLPERIRDGCAARGLTIAAVSGHFNMIDPDVARRRANLDRMGTLAAACRPMGAGIISLSTGTRDPDDMWRRHPDNDTPAAWDDLLASVREALAIADAADVVLAFEPEPANVVRDARRARELLDTVRHPRLKVLLDPANIVAGDLTRDPGDLLAEAIEGLGPDIATVHAKDIDAAGRFCAAGQGIVPWDRCVALLRAAGYGGPLILHTLTEADVPSSLNVARRAIYE